MGKSREPVLQGLVANPKYLPTWYQYDEAGSKMFEEAAYANPYYYIYKSEWPVLEQYKDEMTETIEHPCDYMDLGSGKMKKSRVFIDTFLEKQDNLNFYPVDISEHTLNDASDQIRRDYGRRLNVLPQCGDFMTGFEIIRKNKNRKFITCLGGTLQILPYDDQVTFLQHLSEAMSEDDTFMVTMDTTNDEDLVVKAYLGGDCRSGFIHVYRNMFIRLNREFGTNFEPDTFELEGRFTKTSEKDRASFLTIFARSKINQQHVSPKLSTTLSLEEGEYIRLSSSESISYKYTLEQIETLAEKGQMMVQRVWQSQNDHVACVLMKKISRRES